MSTSSSLRMRPNNAKITKLDISSEKVEAIRYIQQTMFGNKRKNMALKEILGHSLCALCSEIPTVPLSFDVLDGFKKVEYYCDSCATKVYERAEPEDKNLLAAKYNCVIGEQPKTPGYKEGKEVIPK
jgi:hypothetical protein